MRTIQNSLSLIQGKKIHLGKLFCKCECFLANFLARHVFLSQKWNQQKLDKFIAAHFHFPIDKLIQNNNPKMINPCGDSLDMVLPHSVANSTSRKSSKTSNCNTNGWRYRKRPSEEELMEEEMEKLSKCCWGRIGSKSTLLIFVLINFGFDLFCIYLSMEHLFVSYIFGACALISFLTIFAVINGIQREQKTMIKISAMYAGIKAVVLLALTLTALAGLIEEHLTNAQFQPSVKVNLLFCLLPIFVATLFVQYQISQRIVRLFRLRDQFYVISAANLPISGHEFGWKVNRQLMNGGKI